MIATALFLLLVSVLAIVAGSYNLAAVPLAILVAIVVHYGMVGAGRLVNWLTRKKTRRIL